MEKSKRGEMRKEDKVRSSGTLTQNRSDPLLRPDVLPHRFPFLFIERIERIVPGVEGVFAAQWSADNYFSGNRAPSSFKQSLLLEMMAQAAGIVLISKQPPEKALQGQEGYLLKLDGVLFFDRPRAGDRMVIRVKKTHSLGRLHRFGGQVRVAETLLVSGELTLWQDE
jgi:3-hydroxyacyl-[acyl-carrier-protein] dehydratase